MDNIESNTAIDVFDQLDIDLGSRYNIAKYARSTLVWDRLLTSLRELAIWKGVAMQIAGRLDIASFAAYKDSRFDWILAVYNVIQDTDALEVGDIINCPMREQVDLVLDSITFEETELGRPGFTRL